MSTSAPRLYADPRFSDAGPQPPSRFLRLRAFELLIFVVVAILFAMCLCAAPLVADPHGPSGPNTRGLPLPGE